MTNKKIYLNKTVIKTGCASCSTNVGMVVWDHQQGGAEALLHHCTQRITPGSQKVPRYQFTYHCGQSVGNDFDRENCGRDE